MKILFTCGGTAGHINPAIGVAGKIRQLMPDTEILFVGAKGKMESELVPREGYDIKTIEITNIWRGLTPEKIAHNIKTLKNVVVSKSEAKRIIKEFAPDVAVGTGGYVCYPVLTAAAKLGVPTALHESNAVPGLTTRMLEKCVDRIMVGFGEARENYKDPSRVMVTGTPVRGNFFNIGRDEAKRELGLPMDKPLVVSVWGSLGADHMNKTMEGMIAACTTNPDFRVIHSAGKRGFAKMMENLKNSGCADYNERGFEIREYIYDMAWVMAAADIVMCRAGASTISELAALGKPAVLVPSPNVTGNHQEKNARVLEKAGAAKVLLEGEFTPESMLGTIREMLSDRQALQEMSDNMLAFGSPEATDTIADIILGLAKK